MGAEELAGEQGQSYCWRRFVADFMTLTRFAVSAFIVFLGMFAGPEAFPAAVIGTFVGWVTDVLDGPIARAAGGRPTWVSRVDFAADTSLGYSFFLFVILTGLFPVLPALLIMLPLGVVLLLRPTRETVQIVTAPFFGLPVVLSFHAGKIVGFCYLAFIALLLIFRWDDFIFEVRSARSETGAAAQREF